MIPYYFVYAFKTSEGRNRVSTTLAVFGDNVEEALDKFKTFTTTFVLENLTFLEVQRLCYNEYGTPYKFVQTADQKLAQEFVSAVSKVHSP